MSISVICGLVNWTFDFIKPLTKPKLTIFYKENLTVSLYRSVSVRNHVTDFASKPICNFYGYLLYPTSHFHSITIRKGCISFRSDSIYLLTDIFKSWKVEPSLEYFNIYSEVYEIMFSNKLLRIIFLLTTNTITHKFQIYRLEIEIYKWRFQESIYYLIRQNRLFFRDQPHFFLSYWTISKSNYFFGFPN